LPILPMKGLQVQK